MTDDELIQVVLADILPGRDVVLRFKTKERRYWAGYWQWNMLELKHEYVGWSRIMARKQCSQRRIMANAIRRAWRWADVVKHSQKILSRR